MRFSRRANFAIAAQHLILIAFALVTCLSIKSGEAADALKTLTFSGRTWFIRPNGTGGPGPCNWSEQNVWVDAAGQLHLKISNSNGKWSCGEVYTTEKLGFGQYQWEVIGRVDKLDQNVVLGLFPYRGPDGQNEIDIEMSQWGNPQGKMGSFTVWPAAHGLTNSTIAFPVKLDGDQTTQRFRWQSNSVSFQILQGNRTDNTAEIYSWFFAPSRSMDLIPQQAMPTHINLWLFEGHTPADGKEVEIVIRSFIYKKNGI